MNMAWTWDERFGMINNFSLNTISVDHMDTPFTFAWIERGPTLDMWHRFAFCEASHFPESPTYIF